MNTEDVEATEYLKGFKPCDHPVVLLGREREPYLFQRGLGYVCCVSDSGCGQQEFMPQTWQITYSIELETHAF